MSEPTTMEIAKSQKLNTGHMIPSIALGTLQFDQGKPEAILEAVKCAIRAGYRHVDTAQLYCNERAVGQAINELIDAGEIKRQDMFVVTKLASAAMHPTNVRRETERSLKALDMDYIDLYLMHHPIAFSDEGLKDEPRTWYSYAPLYKDYSIKLAFVDPLDTWKEMEKLYAEGLVKNIGVSNFAATSFRKFYEAVEVKPANLQVEWHVWLQQDELLKYCQSVGVTVSAYSPLGSPARPAFLNGSSGNLIDEPVLEEIARKHSRSKAQILLRFLLQRGLIILPKSVNPERIKQNIRLFDFSLDDSDMDKMKALNKHERLLDSKPMAGDSLLKQFPFFPWSEEL